MKYINLEFEEHYFCTEIIFVLFLFRYSFLFLVFVQVAAKKVVTLLLAWTRDQSFKISHSVLDRYD